MSNGDIFEALKEFKNTVFGKLDSMTEKNNAMESNVAVLRESLKPVRKDVKNTHDAIFGKDGKNGINLRLDRIERIVKVILWLVGIIVIQMILIASRLIQQYLMGG